MSSYTSCVEMYSVTSCSLRRKLTSWRVDCLMSFPVFFRHTLHCMSVCGVAYVTRFVTSRCVTIPLRLSFVSAHARFRASNCLRGYLFVFWFFKSSTAKTPAKYVKRRGSAQGRAFRGSQNQKLSFSPLFAPKTAICGT